jgi:peptidoglycan/xylan/chitin deacetylase (PgdA/CDA1 family)
MMAMNPLEIVIPGMALVGVPAWAALHPRAQLFGSTLCRVDDASALTFDDGPNPRVTPQVLSLLEKHRVAATFFVLGKYVEAYPSLAAEIVAAGHSIGNHTYGHPSLLFFSRRRIVEELRRCEDAIFSASFRHSSCVRPPFGFRGPQFHRAAREAGLSKVVMWSRAANDWNPQPASRVTRRIQNLQTGDILLLHDGDHRLANADRSHMLGALEHCLARWGEAGLRFVTV